jgi:hypothetical protein
MKAGYKALEHTGQHPACLKTVFCDFGQLGRARRRAALQRNVELLQHSGEVSKCIRAGVLTKVRTLHRSNDAAS